MRFSGMDFPWGLVELYRLMSLKKRNALRELGHVEVAVDDINTRRSFGRFLSSFDFGVVLKFGVHRSEF